MSAFFNLIAFLFMIATEYLHLSFFPEEQNLYVEQTVNAMVETMSATEALSMEEDEDLVLVRPSELTGETPTAEPTLTATPVPTQTPDAFVSKVTEDFSNGASGFGLTAGVNEDENIRITVDGGRALAEPKMYNRWRSWRLRPPEFADGSASVDLNFVTCQGEDEAGLVLHAANYEDGKGYYFGINCSGMAILYRDNSIIAMKNVLQIILENPGPFHRLEASSQDRTLRFSVDGNVVIEIEDNTYLRGFSGFYTAPQYQNTMKAEFGAFEIAYLP